MKYLSIIKYALILLSVLAIVLGLFGNIDLMLRWSYLLLIATIVCTVALPTIGLLQDPKSAITSLIGLGAIVVVFLIAYALSSADPIPLPDGTVLDDTFALRFSDTALYATYIAFSGVILSIIGSEIYKSFK